MDEADDDNVVDLLGSLYAALVKYSTGLEEGNPVRCEKSWPTTGFLEKAIRT